MPVAQKNRASKLKYVSTTQLELEGFETTFHQKLDSNNRWVLLAQKIPWDDLVIAYNNQLNNKSTGASAINARVVIGAVIIKHMLNLDDRETINQIQENMYLQYFIGLTGFTKERVFDPSLFVDIRNRLSLEVLVRINELIIQSATVSEGVKKKLLTQIH